MIKKNKKVIGLNLEELNQYINDLITRFELQNKTKLNISVYNGDKRATRFELGGISFYEFEGDKILLELGKKINLK